MTDRLLSPNERMTDAFDRASTLNFTTVATVHGALREADLESALVKLEQRHPLLRAGIVRNGKRSRFVAGGAAPIPLHVRDGSLDDVHALAAQSLSHREWPDDGPRAELTAVRHPDERFSLLLCLHHVVSDGSSGILAMRDLLAFLGGVPHSEAAIASPGQTAFLPKGHGGFWDLFRAIGLIMKSSRSERPKRLHKRVAEPPEQRHPHFARIRLSELDSLAVAMRARRAGATVHGLLCAATAQAVQEQLAMPAAVQRILHPVCLRRYLATHAPGRGSIGEAVGCYVSSVETDHLVASGADLSLLARDITATVRQKKADGVPLLTAPVAGPLLTDRFAKQSPRKLREAAEGKLLLNTFAVTNLGKLEKQLDVAHSYGTLVLADLYFVAAGSILGALGASATSFRDQLSFQLTAVEPQLGREHVAAMVQRIEALLVDYARGAEQAA